uniref:Uncharacterized protein n=1 Tax=Trichobilharzia regenti TaxID=157069 RepID=A0AA85JTP1_TRIRE|nr:unnamed protein product [Trichobilharzia regenti]
MSAEAITPQLRQKVLEQLREVTSARKLPKSPEEIENLMVEKSRGVKKTYLNLLSKVINSGTGGSNVSANVHIPSNDPNIQMQSVGNNFQMSGQQQPQQLMNTQIISLPRSGPTSIQSHPQILQVMPQNMPNSINNMQQNHNQINRPRYTISSHPVQQQYQSYPQKNIIQQDGTVIGSQPTHCVPISTIANRVILPPGVAVTQSGQIIQCTTGSGQQPVLIFQQPQTQSIAQITAASSVDQSIPRQTIISSQAMGPSNSIKPVVCQQENIYVTTSSPNAVVFRTSNSGCLTVINPSGTTTTNNNNSNSNDLSNINNTGQQSLQSINDTSSSISTISGTTVSKPILTVLPGPAGTQAKIIRPSISQPSKVGIISNSQIQPRPNTPVSQQYQPRPNIQSNNNNNNNSNTTTPGVSKVQGFTQAEVVQQPSDKDNKPPETSSNSSSNSSSSSNKKGGEVKSSEVQAQIVNGLTDIANRYLSTVKHAIQLASKRPEAAGCVRKYIKLKDILEHPEANLNVLSFAQLPLIEKLLHEIERNPMHLVEEHLQRQARANAANSSQNTSSSSTAVNNTTTSNISTGHSQSQKQETQQQQVRHQLNQQSAQSQSVVAQGQQRRGTAVINQPSPNRFQVPTTNLNTLLSQPFGAPSPTGASDSQQQNVHLRSATQFSPAGANLNASSTHSPDVSTVHGVGADHNRLPHVNRIATSASLLGQSTQSSTGPTGFYASLQSIATEFEKMSDRMSQDRIYSRRVFRAIQEITLETKPFRESIGFQLPEENLQFISKSNKNDVIDFTNTPDPLTATSNATHDNDFIINPLKRKHSSGGIDQRNIPAGSNLKSDDQPIRLDDNLSSSPSSSSSPSNDYESKAKKACFRTTTSPNSSVGKPSSLPPLPTSTSGELHTPTLTDKDSPDILLSSAIEKSDCQGGSDASARRAYEKLFLHTDIIYNPEADPLEHFPTDQLNRLNPKVLTEISKLKELDVHVEGNSHPPSIDDMESYATCLDAGEWNTSCHLKLNYINKDCYLPCQLPEFYIRLTSDYLQTGHLNWYYLPKVKYLQLISNSVKYNNELKSAEKYLDIYYKELDKQFDQIRASSDRRRSLLTIGKTWNSIICTSVARWYKIDCDLLSIAAGKSSSTYEKGLLAAY